MQLLDRYSGASPKLLENRLASDPAFFCEVIRLVYLPKKEEKLEQEPDENSQAIAKNALSLLHEWKTPPGIQSDGLFSKKHFTKWLEQIKEICAESGHLEVALIHVGEVLFYCPPDPTGLWIDQAAAEALNNIDAEDMRTGFFTEVYNSRGAHFVDPDGKPERVLAVEYSQKADEVENAKYQRLAVTIRGISESYERDADKIIDDHSHEEHK